MSRYSPINLDHDLTARRREEFCRCLAALDSLDTVRNVITDLFTDAETVMFIRRIEIAKRLMEGQEYQQIIREMGVGTTTVRGIVEKVSRNGSGFLTLFDALKKARQEILTEIGKAEEGMKAGSTEAFLRKYHDRHALFRPLPEEKHSASYHAQGTKRKRSLKKAGPPTS